MAAETSFDSKPQGLRRLLEEDRKHGTGVTQSHGAVAGTGEPPALYREVSIGWDVLPGEEGVQATETRTACSGVQVLPVRAQTQDGGKGEGEGRGEGEGEGVTLAGVAADIPASFRADAAGATRFRPSQEPGGLQTPPLGSSPRALSPAQGVTTSPNLPAAKARAHLSTGASDASAWTGALLPQAAPPSAEGQAGGKSESGMPRSYEKDSSGSDPHAGSGPSASAGPPGAGGKASTVPKNLTKLIIPTSPTQAGAPTNGGGTLHMRRSSPPSGAEDCDVTTPLISSAANPREPPVSLGTFARMHLSPLWGGQKKSRKGGASDAADDDDRAAKGGAKKSSNVKVFAPPPKYAFPSPSSHGAASARWWSFLQIPSLAGARPGRGSPPPRKDLERKRPSCGGGYLPQTAVMAALLAMLMLGVMLLTDDLVARRRWKRTGAPEQPPEVAAAPEGPASWHDLQCSGPCCSQKERGAAVDVPSMVSSWWSNAMLDGAQVQLRSLSSNMWLAGATPGDDTWRDVGAFAESLAPSQFWTVQRVSSTEGHLLAPSGAYLTARRDSSVSADRLVAGPATLFTILPVEGSPSRLHLRAHDGRYLWVRANGSLACTPNPALAETFEARETMRVPSMRGVNLGNWLMREAWMGPTAFLRVPLLTDGLQFQMRSVRTGKWISASNGPDAAISCSVSEPGEDETFHLRTNQSGGFQMRVSDRMYWSFQRDGAAGGEAAGGEGLGGTLRADQGEPTEAGTETFHLLADPDDRSKYLIRTADGSYLQAHDDGSLSVDVAGGSISTARGSKDWHGRCAFRMVQLTGVRGHWQLSQLLAQQQQQQQLKGGGGEQESGSAGVLAEMDRHYATFITEDDFAYLSELNVNAVRIPVGHWIAQQGEETEEETKEEEKAEAELGGEGERETEGAEGSRGSKRARAQYPFTQDTALRFLDLAFDLGEKYGIGIWVSLHGAPGSQNGLEHSGSRDGVAEWGGNATRVQQMVGAAEFVAARYAARAAFLGLGLLNEPTVEGAPLNVLKEYYQAAYAAVRRHSRCAHVSLQPRVDAPDPFELEGFMEERDGFSNVILEAHYFNLFDPVFEGRDTAFNVAYVHANRTASIARLQAGGRPAMVGEWSMALLGDANPTDLDYAAYGRAQQEAYGKATAGWFFWSHKIQRYGWPTWSFQESVKEGWLQPTPEGAW